MERICIITIVDSIEPTSMPVNEFVIYRATHQYPFSQIMIVCTEERYNGVVVPDNVRVIFVGHSRGMMKDAVARVVEECKINHEYFVFHLHSQTSALIFYSATLFMGLWKHTLFTIHSLYSQRSLKYRISSVLCTMLANRANGVSNSVYKDYQPLAKKIKGKKFTAIVNAVDFDRLNNAIENLPKHSDVCNMKKLVCVDRIIPLKNQEFLIRLMKQLPESTLIFIGKEDKGAIREFARTEGVDDRVIFTGQLSREEVYRKMNDCGIYVSASKIESFHIGVIEGMGIGLIPVVSAIPAHCEIADTAKTFNPLPFDEDLWIKSIKYYQDLSGEELKSLFEENKKAALSCFSIEKMHSDYINIYKELV